MPRPTRLCSCARSLTSAQKPTLLLAPQTHPALTRTGPCCQWQDPNCVNLADWYEAFAAVHAQAAAKAPGGSGGKAKKKAAVKQAKKRKGQGEEGEAGEAAEAADGEERRRQRELAARFSQATAELQYIGFIKPARKRRGDFVQRVVHMPAAGL